MNINRLRIGVALFAALLLALSLAAPASAGRGKGKARFTGHIVTAGDSIVMGAGAPVGQSWPDQLLALSNGAATVSNVGHGGSCLVYTGCGYRPTLLETFDSEVLAQHPQATIVSIGRNELCHSTTDQIIDGYLRLRGRARNAGVQFYIGTITPAGANWPWPCEDQRKEVNARLRQMPNVIDFEGLIDNPRGALPWKYDSGDGLHLNAAGYAVLAQAAWAAVQ
jgi:lysophospholipase L1-like esterase